MPLLHRLKFVLLAFVISSTPLPAWAQPDLSLEGEMIHIASGHFIFGTNKKDETAEALSLGIPKPWYADETPKQKIFLKGFYIDQFEVTNERYKKYVDDLGAVPPGDWKDNNFAAGKNKHPVTWVTWFDAANFCQWAEKKLPSEKQWERAAKGTDGKEYPWGNEYQSGMANLSDRAGSKNKPVAVGSFPKSISNEGVHDLVGNVWEWVEDDYKPYKGSTHKNDYYDSGYKIIRGHSASDIGHFPGALYANAIKMFARSGYRQFANPDEPGPDVGFRCTSENKPAPAKAGLSLSSEPKTSIPSTKTNPVEKPSSPKAASEGKASFNPFAPKSNLPQSGILVLTLLAFIAGVFSFLSPCTLPILPAYFAVTAQTDRARMGMMSLAFFFGLASLFVAMGASASVLGQLLRDYMFQISQIGGGVVAIFGVMTLFGKGFSGASFQGKPASTFIGFFLFGATFALGWTPCVGPILSSILMLAASEKTVLQGMNLLFFYAVGLGLPLILVATLCGNLPKDGRFWTLLRGKGWDVNIAGKTIFLHTTNLFSGILLIVLGIVLATGYMTYVNSLIPIEVQIWFSKIEESVLHWFTGNAR
ncbi:MAG: SUMF1/EgtB/PvdO family nonheme iron enzyme [Nitrospina sp.]|jgi:cytochrome c-type biogenesis protein|nr:SUMF1/EgtB/PvdO family nonheme iron enzyme [Nitrospina sp.]MBT6717954.1 SUMF1/EgtB/PvdO family nonheme iron enzyme [Nitrospina sp.]